MDELEPLLEPEPGLRPIKTYSLEEVATMVMSPDDMPNAVRWLKAQIKDGKASAYKVGRSWRMTHEDVEYLIDRNRNTLQVPVAAPEDPPLWASLSARSRRMRGMPDSPPTAETDTPKYPGGLTRRSWQNLQQSYIPGTTQHNRRMGLPRPKPLERADVEPAPSWYKHVHPESEAVIFNMPPLSDTQQQLLDRVQREREVVVDGSLKKTVESLVRRNLVTYEVAHVLNQNKDGRIYRFTVRAKDS